MRILSNRKIRIFFLETVISCILLLAGLEMISWIQYGRLSFSILLICIAFCALILLAFSKYFRTQDKQLEDAVKYVQDYLKGDTSRRLECSEDGEMYRLFYEVNTMASVLNAQAQRELRSNEFLKQTIIDISHQLKTPLAALNIYNELIAGAESAEDIERFAKSSERELDRIESLIRRLLMLTRLDAGAVAFEKEPANISELFEDVKERFDARTMQEGKTITLSGSDEDALVCDKGWISEAFANIIQNGLDHTAEGGKVDVGWERNGNMISISIKDNGSGIASEDIDNIFKRFYRSRSSSDKQGAGLGLPLAKSIIEGHDGTILVDSQMNQGTRFIINFLNPTEL